MRLLHSKVKPEAVDKLREFYEQRVFPELQKMPGCLYAVLIRSRVRPEDGISMTLWRSQEESEEYGKSEVFTNLLKEVKPFLSESSEWKVQLSENLELSYAPVTEEPVVKSYPIKAQKEMSFPARPQISRMCTRIVSHQLQKGKAGEFMEIYNREIIPALQATEGCLYACLMESVQDAGKEEAISVTIWESKEKAEAYEKSGRFDRQVEKVRHTFSQLSQWQMSLEKGEGKHAKTSDDMTVARYSVEAAKKLK